MPTSHELPYSFCKRYGVIAALSPVSGKLKLTLKNSAPAEAVSEAQRVLGMIDEIEVESDIEFNRLLGQHFEGNRETSFTEAEKIGGELNLDDEAGGFAAVAVSAVSALLPLGTRFAQEAARGGRAWRTSASATTANSSRPSAARS